MRTRNLISYLLLFVCLAALGACSLSNTKKLKVSNVTNEGETPDVYQVVDGTYILDGKDGLNITVKMAVKNSLGQASEVNMGKDKLALQLLDASGNDISNGLLTLNDEGLEKLLTFVQQKNGTEEEFTFTANVAEEGVKEIMKQAKSFKLVNVMAKAIVPFQNGPIITKGIVSNVTYTMTLKYEDGWVYGDYYYDKYGPNAIIQLKGRFYDNKNLRLMENVNGYVNIWDLQYNELNNSFEGSMSRADGKVFNTTMNVVGNTEYDRPMATFDFDESGSAYMPSSVSAVSDYASGSSNQDWDAWLDKYETVVDRLISMSKKAQSGDPSVLADYAKYAEEVSDLAREGENAAGSMTPAQLARYEKILRKAANAYE